MMRIPGIVWRLAMCLIAGNTVAQNATTQEVPLPKPSRKDFSALRDVVFAENQERLAVLQEYDPLTVDLLVDLVLSAHPEKAKVAYYLLESRDHGKKNSPRHIPSGEIAVAVGNAVSDPRMRIRFPDELIDSLHTYHRIHTPLLMLLHVLEIDGVSYVESIASLVDDPDPEIRRAAVHYLAHTGDPRAIDAVAAYVKECASQNEGPEFLSGISTLVATACQHPDTSAAFRNTMFDLLTSCILGADPVRARYDRVEPMMLLRIDRERAIRFLTDTETILLDLESDRGVLEAIKRANLPLPEGTVLGMIRTLRDREPLAIRQLGAALVLLGHHRTESAKAEIEPFIASADSLLRESALEAMLAWHGRGDWSWYQEEMKTKRWTEPQRHAYFAHYADADICNGGFGQFFFNASGEHLSGTVAALRAVGASDRADLVERALNVFGERGPPRNRVRRIVMLEDMADEAWEPIGEIEEQYFRIESNLNELIYRYVLDHLEDFPDAPSKR